MVVSVVNVVVVLRQLSTFSVGVEEKKKENASPLLIDFSLFPSVPVFDTRMRDIETLPILK